MLAPPMIMTVPENMTVIEGTNVTLKCEAAGYPHPDISVSDSRSVHMHMIYLTGIRVLQVQLLMIRQFLLAYSNGQY